MVSTAGAGCAHLSVRGFIIACKKQILAYLLDATQLRLDVVSSNTQAPVAHRVAVLYGYDAHLLTGMQQTHGTQRQAKAKRGAREWGSRARASGQQGLGGAWSGEVRQKST